MLKYFLSLLLASAFALLPSRHSINFESAVSLQDTIKPIWSEIDFEKSGIVNKMAYADTANFMHTKIYPCARCFLRPEVAAALDKASEIAKDKNLKLVIYDCYRPYGFQRKMYDIVKNPKYVAPPGKGSNHNRGAAVDLTLADEEGNILDMGTPFDDFSDLSEYDNQDVPHKAYKNRKLLRNIMVKAGFTPYNGEWWHFDYRQQRYPTAGFQWDCP